MADTACWVYVLLLFIIASVFKYSFWLFYKGDQASDLWTALNPFQAVQLQTRLDHNRQGVFTISDGQSANNAANRYPPDFFYLDPNPDDAARIRAQLEKDDKELPSYEEVMRITAMAETNVANASRPSDDTATRISVPPYMEIDPNPIPVLPQAAEPAPGIGSSASTSRAAAVAITPSSSVV